MRRLICAPALMVAAVLAQGAGIGRLLEQAGQIERALDEYRLAVARAPADIEAYRGFRRLAVELERFDSLLEVSARLRAGDSAQPEFALGAMQGLFGLGRTREAGAEARRFAERWPDRTSGLLSALDQVSQPKVAIDVLERLRQGEKDPLFHADPLLDLYERQQRHADAARLLAGMVDCRPELLPGHLGRLREYARELRTEGLLAQLAGIGDPWARARAQAEVRLATGRQAEAVRAVLDVFTDQQLRQFGIEAEDQRALLAALAVYQRLGFGPDEARVLRKLGRIDQAAAILADDDSPEAVIELADIELRERFDFAAAVRSFRRYLERRPGDQRAQAGLVAALIGQGRLDQARETLDRVDRPGEELLMMSVRLRFYRQEFDSARAVAVEFARRFPASVLADEALGLALLGGQVDRVAVLAQALLRQAQGDPEGAVRALHELATGDDLVAEQAVFLLADLLLEQDSARLVVELLETFDRRFPQSPRRARAGLKRARAFERLGDDNGFRRALERVAVEFPGSVYAPICRALLAEANVPVEPGALH